MDAPALSDDSCEPLNCECLNFNSPVTFHTLDRKCAWGLASTNDVESLKVLYLENPDAFLSFVNRSHCPERGSLLTQAIRSHEILHFVLDLDPEIRASGGYQTAAWLLPMLNKDAINYGDAEGWTALFYAVFYCGELSDSAWHSNFGPFGTMLGVVKALVEAGSDVFAENEEKLTARQMLERDIKRGNCPSEGKTKLVQDCIAYLKLAEDQANYREGKMHSISYFADRRVKETFNRDLAEYLPRDLINNAVRQARYYFTSEQEIKYAKKLGKEPSHPHSQDMQKLGGTDRSTPKQVVSKPKESALAGKKRKSPPLSATIDIYVLCDTELHALFVYEDHKLGPQLNKMFQNLDRRQPMNETTVFKNFSLFRDNGEPFLASQTPLQLSLQTGETIYAKRTMGYVTLRNFQTNGNDYRLLVSWNLPIIPALDCLYDRLKETDIMCSNQWKAQFETTYPAFYHKCKRIGATATPIQIGLRQRCSYISC